MEDIKEIDTNSTGSESGVFMDQLKATFEQLPNDIPIYLFTKRGEDDIFCQTNREIVRLFRPLTDKITFREYYLDHDLAKKWNVESSPTLLINPERYSIRWIGAPMGEEGRTFLEALILVGLGKSNLSDQSIKVIKKIDSPRKIKVVNVHLINFVESKNSFFTHIFLNLFLLMLSKSKNTYNKKFFYFNLLEKNDILISLLT
ncbi:hypothetical protein LCGC14_2079080 [marine sediment metagenome]|uniref:Thioredoxin-like fold domain-containing protein n=1 Tax=marine sediment metagenome TaxID=412755 RepID=A0A0F9EGC1_9ZZZZ